MHFEVVPHTLSAQRYMPPTLPAPLLFPQRARRRRPVTIVVVGTLSADGQKTIWLQQMARLPRHRFQFHYFCFTCPARSSDGIGHSGVVRDALQRLGVPLISQNGFDVDRTLALAPDFPHNVLRLLRQHHRRGRHHERTAFSATESRFVEHFWSTFVAPLQKVSADILLFANSQSSNDVFLREAARLADAALVMDLPNLNPHAALLEDFQGTIVAPSQFAKSQIPVGSAAHRHREAYELTFTLRGG